MTHDDVIDLLAFIRLAWGDPSDEERAVWLKDGKQLDVEVAFEVLTDLQSRGTLLPLFDEVAKLYAQRIAVGRTEASVCAPVVAEDPWRPSTPAEKNAHRRGLAEAREKLEKVSS